MSTMPILSCIRIRIHRTSQARQLAKVSHETSIYILPCKGVSAVQWSNWCGQLLGNCNWMQLVATCNRYCLLQIITSCSCSWTLNCNLNCKNFINFFQIHHSKIKLVTSCIERQVQDYAPRKPSYQWSQTCELVWSSIWYTGAQIWCSFKGQL